MQTTITYNGVLIKDVITNSIDHSVAKDSTGVDQIGVRCVVSATGVIHSSAGDHTGFKAGRTDDDGNPQGFGAALSSVLQKLTKDRRRFTMKIGTSVLYDIVPGAAEKNVPTTISKFFQRDLDNGPKPHVTVVKIISGASATIQFQIEFVIPNCGGDKTENNSGLINLRFWIVEDIDCRTWLTTRYYRGILRVAHKNISPHALARVAAIPDVQPGFQRSVINTQESDNGLELSFLFQDQEIVAAPPWNSFLGVGAVSWDGEIGVSTNTQGATCSLEARLNLTGPKGTPQSALEDIAFRVILAKLQLTKLKPQVFGVRGAAQPFIWDFFGINEKLNENSIGMIARVTYSGNKVNDVGLSGLGDVKILGQPMGDLGIGYDSSVAFNPGQSAGLAGLFLSALQTPCSPQNMPATITYATPKERKAKRNKGKKRSEDTSNEFGYPADVSKSQIDAMYFEYLLNSEIAVNTGRIALATGAANPSSGNSQPPSLAVISLHQPTAIRRVNISASRVNKHPEIPTPNVPFTDRNGIVHTPIGMIPINSSAPQLSADNRTLMYQVEMEMWYALSRPPKLGESLPVGCLPYRAAEVNDPSRVIGSEFFVPPGNILT